jgi:hypothetical protein
MNAPLISQSLVARLMELFEQTSPFNCPQKAQACVMHGAIVIRINRRTDAAAQPCHCVHPRPGEAGCRSEPSTKNDALVSMKDSSFSGFDLHFPVLRASASVTGSGAVGPRAHVSDSPSRNG